MNNVVSFEDIGKHFTSSNKSLIVEMYHWASPDTENYSYPLELKNLKNDKEFFVCDDPYTWSTPHLLEVCQLYKIDCIIRKPLVVLEQFLDFESIFNRSSLEYKLATKGGFDSIIYTPHVYGRGVRQCLIRNAKEQVLDIREIDKPHIYAIERIHQEQSKFWTDTLFNKK